MDEKTKKELEEAHKKAMEAISSVYKETKETLDLAKKMVGL